MNQLWLCLSSVGFYGSVSGPKCIGISFAFAARRLRMFWLNLFALQIEQSLIQSNLIYLSPNFKILVNIVVMHGICFCWCMIGLSGTFDS